MGVVLGRVEVVLERVEVKGWCLIEAAGADGGTGVGEGEDFPFVASCTWS